MLVSKGSATADFNDKRILNWNQLVNEFFDEQFTFNPSQGTVAGFHQFDSELEDYALEGVRNEISFANRYLCRLEGIDSELLPTSDRQDYELITNHLNSTLLELEGIRKWETDPDHYSSGITESAFAIISRNFAPLEERLKCLIERERKMPAVFTAAKANLRNPPYIYTKVAIQQLPGLIDFFREDIPGIFAQVKNEKLLSEFRYANAAVVAALRDYGSFLEDHLLAHSKGDFRIGAEKYQKKLLYDEMVDVPLSQLLQIGYDDLRRNQLWLNDVAAEIDPRKSPRQVLDELKKDHPHPNNLLQAFSGLLGSIRQFIVDKNIVSLPSSDAPIMEETPPFLRALTFASMDSPGPFERVAKEAFFNVTLPEPHWSEAETESFMGEFNRGTITSTAIHEVYPGHYVQFLWLPQVQSKVRKLLGCLSNAEGWAHYCEQMMLDEGYGNGDPTLRLGQLQDALLRNARYIVGISMHSGEMTFEEAVQFFQNEAYQPESVAELEATRGTSDPTYLVYTLGKLQIMNLREDYRRQMGQNFSLEEFHSLFLRQGFPPIKIVRESMMAHSDSIL